MKKVLTFIILSIGISVHLKAQSLENTTWRLRPQVVTSLGNLVGIDYDSITISFHSPNIFEMTSYSPSETAIGMKGFWSETNNTGFFVDTIQNNPNCETTDTCRFTFSIIDTVLTLSSLHDQCSIRGVLMAGDYYGHNSFSSASVKENSTQTFLVYPNPATDFIQLNDEYEQIQILATDGKLIAKFYKKQTIPIAELPNGIYWISVEKNGKRAYEKLIKQ